MDSHWRSVAKGLSWRILATIVTMVVVFLYSGELGTAALVGTTDAFAKIGLFWGHERIWEHVGWGRRSPPPAASP